VMIIYAKYYQSHGILKQILNLVEIHYSVINSFYRDAHLTM